MKSFESVKIGKLQAKNRFVRSATWENMATEDGHMTSELYDVYDNLAKGEVGLIITGYANIVKEEKPNPGMMGIYDDSFIEEYKRLTSNVHKHGSKILMQLAYGGTKTTYNLEGRTIFAPSHIAERGTKTLGTPMTKEDITYIVDAFAASGKRAKEAGFDGVEIHAAHSYLINQFLSPYYNRRVDEYGGSLENRMRFLVEIYEEMRRRVGDFPILVKLTASDFFEGGLTFEETLKICSKLEELKVDGLEISGNIHGKAKAMTGQTFDGYEIGQAGYFLEYGKVVSDHVDVPVITVGGFSELEDIDKVFNESKIEMVALSRPLLTEPDLVSRWLEGDHKPAKCVRCSRCRTQAGNYCTVFN